MWNVVLGWTPAEIKVYLIHLRPQLRDPNIHPW